MEARWNSAALLVAILLSLGASHRTQNFVVTASSPELAHEIAEAAEKYRRDLALEWLGRELPPWRDICPIETKIAPHLGAGGMTQFSFDRGRPYGWTMVVQGSRERVLDSVLPHEVTHTIFATHFGCPLPRWADEGACTIVEHASERKKQQQLLIQFLTPPYEGAKPRSIAFNHMFAMREYPPDILPLYSQGFSLTRYLIAQGGKQKFVKYIGDGMRTNDWTGATQEFYGFESLDELQVSWLDWVRSGSPESLAGSELAASGGARGAAIPATQVAAITPGAQSPLPRRDNGSKAIAVTPVSNTAATTASALASSETRASGSWYARQRDLSRSAAAAQPAAALAQVPARPVAQQSLTRPQEPQQAQQTILEWQR